MDGHRGIGAQHDGTEQCSAPIWVQETGEPGVVAGEQDGQTVDQCHVYGANPGDQHFQENALNILRLSGWDIRGAKFGDRNLGTEFWGSKKKIILSFY